MTNPAPWNYNLFTFSNRAVWNTNKNSATWLVGEKIRKDWSRKRYHFLQREFILANEATKVQMDNKLLTNENASFLDIVYRVNLQVCMYVWAQLMEKFKSILYDAGFELSSEKFENMRHISKQNQTLIIKILLISMSSQIVV